VFGPVEGHRGHPLGDLDLQKLVRAVVYHGFAASFLLKVLTLVKWAEQGYCQGNQVLTDKGRYEGFSLLEQK
jgi:hypothetical protein